MKTWVSVTSNGTRKLSEPLLSRFRVYLSKYYFSQFHEIAVNIYYGVDHFRVKNIPHNNESRLILQDLGFDFYGSVDSIKSTVRSSLAGSDTRSNVV
jgi:hypothetical protein